MGTRCWIVLLEGRDEQDPFFLQLKDMKGSIEIDGAPVSMVRRYASICGWTLARAHARSGDPAAIAGY